ncbi:hypothetical protein ACWD0G_14230 [Streptomyces goshikiensis]
MTETPIPPQPPGTRGDDPRDGRPPVHPSVSEAGRLLCAGTYLNAVYRDRVIEELYVHEERIVAPSYGFDASRVLAHALRARRTEQGWAAAVLGAWFAGSLLTSGALALLLFPFLLLSLADWLRDRGGAVFRVLSLLVRIYGWWSLLVVLLSIVGTMLALLDDDSLGSVSLGPLLFGQALGAPVAAVPLVWVPAVFAAVVTVVGLQRGHVARTIAGALDPRRYADPASDPAEADTGVRFARVRRRIRAEQHAPAIMYDINNPFCGAGDAHQPWQLSVELRPREDLEPGREPTPVTNAHIVERIVPLLQRLRVPSPHGSPEAEAAVLDRMRELAIDECVFLPATGLRHRDEAPAVQQRFAAHRADAIEEGGERRRHFLRIRVGGWDENLVVTVFVRVHTQGGMLMLEVAPHVLLPVRTSFQNADADAQRHVNNNRFGKVVSALRNTPGSFAHSLATLGRAGGSWGRIASGGHGGARPEGPRVSVRELAAQDNGSLFHLMDLDRYLKTIQDRVVGGITVALHEAGWHTEEFAQRAVHVAEGGVYIRSMSDIHDSAFSIGGSGHHNSAHRGRSHGGGR